VRDAARLCEQLGHDVSEASPEYDGRATRRTFATIYGASIAGTVEHWCGAVGKDPDASDFEPTTWAVAAIGWRATAADLWLALGALGATTRAFDAFFREHDLWLTPTTAEPPLRIGEMDPTPQDPLAGFRRSGPFVPHTAIANQVGCPAMSVPLHWTAENLPIGAHFIAPFGAKRCCCVWRSARAHRPWADRLPPLA
jgi:amidase